MNTTEARQLCRSLFLETLPWLQIAPRLRSRMGVHDGVLKLAGGSFSVSQLRIIRVAAFGKAAFAMAEAAAGILRCTGVEVRGVVAGPAPARDAPLPAGPGSRDRGSESAVHFEYFYAGHPYPDEQSLQAAEAVLELLRNCTAQDLVLFLISGGGSSLLEKPLDAAISLDDLRRFHQTLVTCGATIREMNILRKHFSAVKGGRLAQAAVPAAQVTLYVSDVPDHLPSAVASGPTMPDESTVEDCRRIASQYDLLGRFPSSVRELLESGKLPETPKPGDTCFAQSRYDCLLSNADAVARVLDVARARGIYAEADSSCDEWRFDRAADYLLSRLAALRQAHPGKTVLLASGGELSSPVAKDAAGLGGRNQAFVLYCVPKIAGQPLAVLSAGTDGIDGNSPAAGAVADGASWERASALGLEPQDYLSRSDSYSFFDTLKDAIVTGPTGTNVRDVRLLLGY